MGTSEEVRDRMEAEEYECCAANVFSGWQSLVPMPLWWVRAKILYTLFPHDRSLWSNLRNPWWWLLSLLKVFPVFYVSMIFWVLLFLIRDKKDRFQLVSFIVELKQAHFISHGVLASILGCVSWLSCVIANVHGDDASVVNPETCQHAGLKEGFIASSVLFALQILLTWVHVGLIAQSDRLGDRMELDAVAKFEKADTDGSGCIGFEEFCALSAHAKHDEHELRRMFDSLDVSKDGFVSIEEFRKFQGLHGADILKSTGPAASKKSSRANGNSTYLWCWVGYDAACCLIVVGLVRCRVKGRRVGGEGRDGCVLLYPLVRSA